MTDLEARILSHRPDAAHLAAMTQPLQTQEASPGIFTTSGVTPATGGCYHCGKPTEFADHNSCMDCLEKAMADLEGTEAFDG